MSVTFQPTAEPLTPPLLSPGEPPPFTVVNPDGKAKCLLVCDHASNYVPKKLGNLGLDEAALQGHMAWDIGVAEVTRHMAALLDAPAILSNYSRLVIDPNRRVDHPTSIVTVSEGVTIPGNAAMPPQDRALRIATLYEPYHAQVGAMVDSFLARGIVPAVISIHSFTRNFYNQVRPWEIAVLWVQDPRLPLPLIEYFRQKGFTVGDNQPYDARIMRGTTVNHHADARGLPNALVEVRNDLLADTGSCRQWAEALADCFAGILRDPAVNSLYDGPQVVFDPQAEQRYFDDLIERAKKGD